MRGRLRVRQVSRMNHAERMAAADRNGQPKFYFVYVLEMLDNGEYYVGHTGHIEARLLEHAVGRGAEATAGREFKLRVCLPFQTRKEAQYSEARWQAALRHSPANIAALVTTFDQVGKMVRPEKTLEELERESRARQLKAKREFHLVTFYPRAAVCKHPWAQYGTYSLEDFLEYQPGSAVRYGAPYRDQCQACLEAAILMAVEKQPTAG